jgi:hypothetical protein
MRSASPLEGKTTDWRAVCGRPASTVRRAGRETFPTPIVAARLWVRWPGRVYRPDTSLTYVRRHP